MSGATGIRALSGRAADLNLPLNVLVELTHRCNLSCFQCYVVRDARPELSTEEVVALLEDLAAAGTLFLALSGGEVLLREDLSQILSAARRLHFALRLFTNGTLIDAEAADLIASASPVDVGISIYGATAESHDGVTGVPGSFDRSMRAFRLLRRRGVRTRMKCLLMRRNLGELDAIAELAASVGAGVQWDPHLTPRNDGDRSALSEQLGEQDLERVLFGQSEEPTGDGDCAPCAAARETACVSPSGIVQPCVQLPFVIGDMREQRFAEIWLGERAAEIRSVTLAKLEACSRCEDCSWCDPCLGLNLIETGTLTEPSGSVCRMARAKRKGAA